MKKYTSYKIATDYIQNKVNIPVDCLNDLPEHYDEEGNLIDFFDYFITDCDETLAHYLKDTFGLIFICDEALAKYILCVPFYGVAWGYVEVEPSPEWAQEHQELCFEKNIGELYKK